MNNIDFVKRKYPYLLTSEGTINLISIAFYLHIVKISNIHDIEILGLKDYLYDLKNYILVKNV